MTEGTKAKTQARLALYQQHLQNDSEKKAKMASAPLASASFHGLLFDMDGTIIESTPAVIKHYQIIGEQIGVDPDEILKVAHGRRTIDVLRHFKSDKADWDFPWAIVTSGTTGLVTGWLKVLGLPKPEHMVVAEDVEQGKPDPAGYLKGRQLLGLEAGDKDVLVFEDSPAGIEAGKAAGCKVVGVVSSHTVEQIRLAGPDWIVKDLSSVVVVGREGDKVVLEFRNDLVENELAN
ncbi:glycerol 3-phosphatase 1 [Blastomyces parvus]|uniref:Glycerol 3-phosphatase 1 n=1 Tax=Blastomyces parvus TaxID=2060905 RepID=A0A2B7WY92_9EURO|nr:glycerol 3-phosphatase 1 [Blastomyces parvus]